MAIFGAESIGKARKPMGNSQLKLVTPDTVFGAVPAATPPRKRRNADVRSREYLTEAEVERLIKAAADNRHVHRDATMILVTFRHGADGRGDATEVGRRRLRPWRTARRPRQERQGGDASA
jgi:hypothetical protein